VVHRSMSFLRPDSEVVVSYRTLRRRVIDFLRTLPDSESRRVVPACPDWTVSALVSHMMGINEDILAGRMGGFTSDAWTQAHVDRHLGESIPSLADAWERMAREFDVILPTIPAPRNSQLVMDAVTHELDLRYAVGSTEARDSDAIDVALGWLLDWIERERGGLDQSLSDTKVSKYELLRSLTGRRSVDQMNTLGLSGDWIVTILRGTPLKPPTEIIESI